MPFWLRLGLVLLIVALLAAPPSAAPAQSGPPLEAIQRVLDIRVEAVRTGDRAAYLETVDPRASAEFRDAQARSFDGLRSIPLESYRLVARMDDTGDLSAGLATRYGGDEVFLPETRVLYRLRGVDDRDAVDSLWITYVRRNGRWYVGGDSDLSDVGLDTFRNLWDLGPVRVMTTEHFLVMSHPEDAARADALTALAEEAVALLDRRWREVWSHRVPIVLPNSVEELETMLQTTFDLDNFVAFASYGALRDRGWQSTAPRVYAQDRNLSRYPRVFQLETLVHELLHVSTVPHVGPFVPAWVHEGVAEWVARGPSTAAPGSDGQLPRDYEFTTGGGAAIVRSYRESHSAASFLAATAGADALARLVRGLGTPKIATGNTDHHLDVVLRDIAGLTFAEFERKWAAR